MNFHDAIAVAGLMSFTLLCAVPAAAEMTNFKATLNGNQEVPPVQGAAIGSVDLTYDSETRKITWLGTYPGLTAPPIAAHLHGPAKPGTNAAVALPIQAVESPFSGAASLTPSQAAELMADEMYFNIHTAKNPNGEIRGQVTRVK
jgi:CHRD domain